MRGRSPRKRAGVSPILQVEVGALNMMGENNFQFDSTGDGKAMKIASMFGEHTRVSLPNIVERSIIGDRLVEELKKAFAAAGGPPKVLRIDKRTGFHFPKRCNSSAMEAVALQRCLALRGGYLSKLGGFDVVGSEFRGASSAPKAILASWGTACCARGPFGLRSAGTSDKYYGRSHKRASSKAWKLTRDRITASSVAFRATAGSAQRAGGLARSGPK